MLPALRSFCKCSGFPEKISRVPRRTTFSAKSVTDEGNTIRKRNTTYDGAVTGERLQSLEKNSPLRSVKGYSPPSDVEDRIEGITKDVCGNTPDWRSVSLDNRLTKFKLLTRCIKEFDHDIANPELPLMNTAEDVVQYFNTPVFSQTSYEDLAKLDLPRNLHVQQDYQRFDPDTDTMFGGVTAFPGRPTIIKGLRSKKKYKGSNVPEYWPDQHLPD